jgi:PBP1b-binding outer membrane lipoprotein LpoB
VSDVFPPSPDDVVSGPVQPASHAVEAGLRTGFGVAAIVIEVTRAVAAGSAGTRALEAGPSGSSSRAGDTVMGAAWAAARVGSRAVELSSRVVSPVVGVALNPPLVPRVLRLGTHVDALARRWRAERAGLAQSAIQSGQGATPIAVEAVARAVDVDRVLAAVVDQIDVDALAARLLSRMDLTAAGQVALRGVDIDALAGELIDKVQVEPLVSQVVDRVDTVGAVGRVMDELPTDALVTAVLAHLDLEALIAAALDQVDLTGLVVQRVDLGALVTAALDQVDLTDVVLERVDLATVINSALDRIDMTTLVMDRVDLPLVASTVIEEIDLAGTIRDSTGSVATEAVKGVRMTSVDADRAVARLVDRLTLRRRGRRLDAPGTAESLADEGGVPDDGQLGR